MTNLKAILCFIKLFLVLFLFTCELVSAQPEISYVGSSTIGVYINAASTEYKNATISMNTIPESTGAELAIAKGTYDFGGVARKVRSMILQKNVKSFYIGKDAIGVWINKDNPVGALSKAQLKGIFTGKINNWNKVGGPDHEIKLYITSKRSATYKVFSKIILQGGKYHKNAVKVTYKDAEVIDNLKKDKWGIGQLSFAIGEGHSDRSSVKKVNIGEEEASSGNPNYPIGRPLYLITKGEPTGSTKAFIDWTLSEKGQAIVKRYFIGK